MRLGDLDKMAAEEFAAYMSAQLKVDDVTRKVNEVVHMKIQQIIADTPTVDAVPVVRCKDCKRFEPRQEIEGVSWTGFCNYGEFHTDEEDFCSRGERRNDG